jgi:DNA-binding transcriptional MerR regulator
MKRKKPIRRLAVQLYEPDPEAVYTLELAERLAQVPRRTIVVYYKHGLVPTVKDPTEAGFYFNDEGIRVLRRIEHLRRGFGINLVGVKIILALMEEAERLRAEARFLRRR